MDWNKNISLAKNVLASRTVPSSEEIISLIKRVNPTNLSLPEIDKQGAYEIKNQLQNLLLENYGESFFLIPHPYDTDIVLIKHRYLPLIDACHANINRMSHGALGLVDDHASTLTSSAGGGNKIKKTNRNVKNQDAVTPEDLLKKAKNLLEEFDYDDARETLGGMWITDLEELPTLRGAVQILINEIGAYETAINVLCSHPKHFVKDKKIQEYLALAFYKNNMLPEARTIFEMIHPNVLDKEALYTYASIIHQDGNSQQAYVLLNMADQRDGFVTSLPSLRGNIEKALKVEADKIFDDAKVAFDRNELKKSLTLARGALELFPKFREAGELVNIIEAIEHESLVTSLWERLGSVDGPQEHLIFLEQLLEIDEHNAERIRKLLVEVRYAIKEQDQSARIEKIRLAVSSQKWSAAFDDILEIISSGDHGNENLLFSLSPYMPLLKPSKFLQRYSHNKIKVNWLKFIEVEKEIRHGKVYGQLPALNELKRFFSGCQLFDNVFSTVYKAELQNSRTMINGIIQQMFLEDCTASTADRLLENMRRHMQLIPDDEKEKYWIKVNSRLEQLKPRTPEDVLLENYNESLKIGNLLKCESIKKQIENKDDIDKIDKKFKDEYKIDIIKINVIVDESLIIKNDSELNNFKVIGITNSNIIIDRLNNSLIILQPKINKATEYKSIYFNNLNLCDHKDFMYEYLFKDTEKNIYYRMILSEEIAYIKSIFTYNSCCNSKELINNIFMVSDRLGDYLWGECTYPDKNGDIISSFTRVDIFKKINVSKFIHKMPDDYINFTRLSYSPDKFLFMSDMEAYVLNKNAEKIEISEDYLPLVCADVDSGSIYTLWSNRIEVLDSKFNLINKFNIHDYDNGFHPFFSMYIRCISTDSNIFISYDKEDNYYAHNFLERKTSNHFKKNSIIYTSTNGRFYICDLEGNSIRLRDVTMSLDILLNWKPSFND